VDDGGGRYRDLHRKEQGEDGHQERAQPKAGEKGERGDEKRR
jgi:hypothetical protein